MLLVDDEQPEPLEAHVTLEKAMCPNDDVDLARLQALDGSSLRFVIDEPRQHLDRNRELAQPLAKDVEVLLCQNRRRRQQRDLFSAHRRLERCAKGKLGLAEADIAA